MSQNISDNESKSLNQQGMNNRRNFLKLMLTLTGGMLMSCLLEVKVATPAPAPGANEYPTEIPPTVNVPQNTDVPPPTDIIPSPAPTQATEAPPLPQLSQIQPNYSCGPATGAAYIITSLCLRDRACIDVCPVEAIVPGFPINEWSSVYIDQDTCISCGACVPECPFAAIFPTEEVPSAYVARGGEYINRPGLTGHYEGVNHHGNPVVLDSVYQLQPGEIVDLTQDIGCNNAFYTSGPGYEARNQDNGM